MPPSVLARQSGNDIWVVSAALPSWSMQTESVNGKEWRVQVQACGARGGGTWMAVLNCCWPGGPSGLVDLVALVCLSMKGQIVMVKIVNCHRRSRCPGGHPAVTLASAFRRAAAPVGSGWARPRPNQLGRTGSGRRLTRMPAERLPACAA